MLWRHSRRDELSDRAAAFRRSHERFLDRALRTPWAFPHIPLRRVADGGFDRLRRRGGQARAEQWWHMALSRLGGPGGRGADNSETP
ncbi:MAG: hypothetical protein IT437_09350 [Phycisphaerales bacterium]|nr:hypothetical protein [Phycisphaerales bacterium]